MGMVSRTLASVMLLALACGEPEAVVGDAGPDGGACVADGDCDDGLFCTGEERCAPGEADADTRGCVRGMAPCAEGEPCSETTLSCEPECPDAEGDGATDASCGGTDCDDANRDVFPGATELCDELGIDEDCDPMTLGPDADDDGAVGVLCCNRVGSNLRCGTDCDDTRPSVNPEQNEVCNGFDDDCDGSLDEGVTTTYYRDRDGDLFGDVSETAEACTPPTGFTILPGDCDDSTPLVNPGATESCAMLGTDDDCDGAVDEICECEAGSVVTCGPGEPLAGVGICRDGRQTCSPAGLFGDCEGGVFPGAETCDGLDEDCDTLVDEGGGRECPRDGSVEGTTVCGRAGRRRCSATCTFVDPAFFASAETTLSCDYCFDTAAGVAAELPFATRENRVFLDAGQGAGDFNLATNQVNDGSSASEVGAVWSDAITIGYGPTTVAVTVQADATSDQQTERSGWGLGFFRDDSITPRTVGTIAAFGFPAGADGWRFTWVHARGRFTSFPNPVLELRELPSGIRVRSGGGSIATDDFQLAGSATPRQRVELVITPDDPRTPSVDETAIALNVPLSDIPGRGGCRNEGSQPCRRTISPGDVYRAVVTGWTNDTGTRRIAHQVIDIGRFSTVATSEDACPE